MLILSSCDLLVNKFTFFPNKTYEISGLDNYDNIEEKFITTEDGLRIQTFLLKNDSSKNILIYFHGNAGNISQRMDNLINIRSLGVNVFGVGYRGYGKSEGKPNEKGIYLDGKSAYRYVMDSLGYKENQICIYGRSLGSTVAIEIAKINNAGGLVLITPLSNGVEMAKHKGLSLISSMANSVFENDKKAKSIEEPALVVHGTKDKVIPFEMGKKVYTNLQGEKTFVKITGADHNNVIRYKEYRVALKEFLNKNF